MRNPVFLFLSIFYCFVANAQIYQFQKTYGTGNQYVTHDMRATSDGGYIFTGSVQDTVMGGFHDIVFKTDAAGALQWQQNYSDGGEDWLYSIELTPDGGYIFAGSSNANVPPGHLVIYIVKTDNLGNLQWSKTLSDNYTSLASSIKNTSDGNYILTGCAGDSISGGKLMMAKISNTGALMWANKYGSPSQSKDCGLDVIETNDGGYAAVGYTGSYGAGNEDVYTVKTDVAGNLQWAKTYGGFYGEEGYAILKVNNENNLFICGIADTWGLNFSAQAYLLKIDPSGNLLWSETYSGMNETLTGYSLVQEPDNNLAIAGTATKLSDGTEQYCLFQTDVAGHVNWSEKYSFAPHCETAKMRQAFYSGFAIAGVETPASFSGLFYFVKTDSLGNSGCHDTPGTVNSFSPATITGSGGMRFSFGNVSEDPTIQQNELLSENTLCLIAGMNDPVNEFSVTVFPNPFAASAEIKFKKNIPVNSGLVLYDVFGNEVQRGVLRDNKFIIERNDLTPGIYFWKIVSGETEFAGGKIIAE